MYTLCTFTNLSLPAGERPAGRRVNQAAIGPPSPARAAAALALPRLNCNGSFGPACPGEDYPVVASIVRPGPGPGAGETESESGPGSCSNWDGPRSAGAAAAAAGL